MTLQTRMEELLNEYVSKSTEKFNQRRLSLALGITRATVTDWLNGKTKTISGENAQKVAKFFGVESEWVQLGTGPKYKKLIDYDLKPEKLDSNFANPINETLKRFPRVVGTAQCGAEGYYMDLDSGDGYVEFEAARGAIAIRIKGHSMHPAIKDGWFVIIEPNLTAEPGEYVLLKFKDGKKMIKELIHIRPDGYLLLSVNGNERITALHTDLESDIQPISAILPPRKHKEFV